MFSLFRKRLEAVQPFDLETQQPAVRRSICTGEMTVGYIDRATGKFHEMVMVPDRGALEAFFSERGVEMDGVKEIY